MNYKKLEFFVGKPRLDRFLTAAGNSKSKARKLYRTNIRVGQSFYPLLHLLETFLRNAVNQRLTGYFNTPDWIISEKNRFMSDPSLGCTKFYLKNSVHKAENSIKREGRVITSGKVIAEQTFSFWASFFEAHHYKLIGGIAIQCFPNKPPSVNRSTISQKLTLIRKFRNRLYHNEPICFAGNCIDFNHAIQIRKEIYDLLDWMDNELITYVAYFDSIAPNIQYTRNL